MNDQDPWLWLEEVQGDKALASKLLGVSTRTLYRKLDRKDD